MSRNYARIQCDLWSNDEYTSLPTSEAQLVYQFLLQQRDISGCGRHSIALGRWAAKLAGATRNSISDALDALAEANLILLDWETDELAIRTYVKHDAGANPQRLRAAENGLVEITSEAIRSGILSNNPNLADWVSKQASDATSDATNDATSDETSDSPAASSQQPAAANHQPSTPLAAALVTTGEPVENLPAAAAAAIEILIEHKILNGEARKPRPFRRSMPAKLAAEHGKALTGYLEGYPDADAGTLAEHVLDLGPVDIHNATKAIEAA